MALLRPHLKGDKMKRIITLILAATIILTFAACKPKEDQTPTTTKAPETTAAPETTTEEPETTTEAPTEKRPVIEGKYVAAEQEDYGIEKEEYLNKITFKDDKAYVQMNFMDAVAEFEVTYQLDEKNGVIILGAGKAQNGTVVFNSGAVLTPDEYWQTLTINGMEKAFVLEGYACPQFFEDGTNFIATQIDALSSGN